MKKGMLASRALVLAAAAAFAFIGLMTCTNPVSDILNAKGFGIAGTTWVNPSYGMPPYQFGPGWFKKLTVSADGTFRAEDNMTPTPFVYTGTYTVEGVSVSGDSRIYQIKYSVTGAIPFTHWVLVKITSGNAYESTYRDSNYGGSTYPSSVSSSVTGYMTASLQ